MNRELSVESVLFILLLSKFSNLIYYIIMFTFHF